MSLDWSPGDLSRQRLVVGRIVARSEGDRRRVAEARGRLVGRLHSVVVPLAVSAAAVAGAVVIGRFVTAQRSRGPASRPRAEAAPTRTRVSRLQSLVGLALSLAQIYLRVRTYIAPPATEMRSPRQVR